MKFKRERGLDQSLPQSEQQFVCFSLWGDACEHSTIDLLVCSGFIIKTVTDRYKNVLKRLVMDEN